MYPSGSPRAHIYGTPKMHKFSSSDSFPKLRPIFSSIGTFHYNLVHFLRDILLSLVPNYYPCKDAFSFVSQIKNANLSRKFLVSYEVTSLFTNIPLQESIDITINFVFYHNSNLNVSKAERKRSQTHSLFNNKFYNQMDGKVMVCPFAPFLAKIFRALTDLNLMLFQDMSRNKIH